MIEKLVTKYGNASFNKRDGYRIRSRKEGNYDKRLHRLIWEDHYGEIPQNCYIIFKDGDKTNLQLSNLELKRKQDSIDTEFGKGYLNRGYRYVNKSPLHHLVWEKYYGKKVPKGYHIHHKDENKTNNDINNLELMTASDHMKLHMSKRNIPHYGKERKLDDKIAISKSRNSIGFFRVTKQYSDNYKQGFRYIYKYYKNGKQKSISSVSIDKLREKVLSKNLEWKKIGDKMSDEELKNILKNIQTETNKIYEEFGATDEIIELQAAINGLRHKYDVVDETELTKFNPGFVQ